MSAARQSVIDSQDAAVLVAMVRTFAFVSVVFTPVGGAILAAVVGFYLLYVQRYELKYIPR